MSLDDSTAPETADSFRRRQPAPPPRPSCWADSRSRSWSALVGFFMVRGASGEPEGADCITEVVTLTTAPVMEDLVKQAVKDVNADEPCIDIQVTAGTVKDVVALLSDPNAELPEIWIPDSPTWKGQLTSAGWTGTPIAEVARPDARRPHRRPGRQGPRLLGLRARRRQPVDGRPERRGCLRARAARAVRRDEEDRRDRADHRGEDRPGRPDLRRARRRRQRHRDRPLDDHRLQHRSWCPRPSRPTWPPAAATTSSPWWRRRPACRCCSTR